MKICALFSVPAPFDPANTFVTSSFLSPTNLAIVRSVFAFYTFFTLLFTLIWDSLVLHTGSQYFTYFTYLTYTGLCSYFWASAVQTWAFALSKGYTHTHSGTAYPLQRWPRPLQFLHVLLQATVTTFPFLVTIVFWALLASPSVFANKESSWSNISVHALNSVFALSEIILSNTQPAPWRLLPFGIVILALYVAVAYITHATQGYYTYSFLNPQKEHGFLAVYIVGIAVAYCIVFAIVHGVVQLRVKLTASSNGPLTATAAKHEGTEDWQEVERPATADANANPSEKV